MVVRSGRKPAVPVAVDPALQPVTLDPKTFDITVRFQHIEPKPTASGLKAAWSFDEGSGYEFRDSAGSQHTAYITGSNWNSIDSGLTASFRREGRRLGGVYLDGTRWLQVQHHRSLENDGAITLSAWIRPDAAPADLVGRAIIQKLEDGKGYALVVGEAGALRTVVLDDDGGEHAAESPAGLLRQGEWTHVVAASDAASGELRLYVDGLLASRAGAAPFTLGNAEADLVIGHSAGAEDGFKGTLDEVALYDQALGDAEARDLYIVGLPKLYTQTRATVDADRHVWTRFRGNHPVPHPIEPDTIFSARFNGSLRSDQGQEPAEAVDPGSRFVPGRFGGALNAVATAPITYTSPITSSQGTFEAWFIPVRDASDPSRERKKVLFRAEGARAWLELFTEGRKWTAALGSRDNVLHSVASGPLDFAYDVPVHVAATWGDRGDGKRELALFVNGVEAGREPVGRANTVFNRRLFIGGSAGAPAYGYVDDVRISSTARAWGDIYPRGHHNTESSELDLMDGFSHGPNHPPVLWRPGSADARWRYATKTWEDDGTETGNAPDERNSFHQGNASGFHPVFHPDALGQMSSIEAGVAFETQADGWAGVFVQSPSEPGQPFSGYSFAINPDRSQLRIAIHRDGAIGSSKILPYDFPMTPRKTYTLTLSSINDGVLRGYVDGNSLMSMAVEGDAPFTRGSAGLFTENTSAHFDDVHFSALTPSTEQSRQIQARVFADGRGVEDAGGYDNLTLNAFRWKKRHGLLPWHRTYKNPQPPGFILSADDGTPVPNPPAAWRSEDSAICDLLSVDGNILLVHRGNPRINNVSGVAQLGVLRTTAAEFDAIHFTDPNAGLSNEAAHILRGHPDTADPVMRDKPPRDQRFQVNDQGGAYVGNGQVVVFAREFRNHQGSFPWYRWLVYGMYDIASDRWDNNGEPHYVEWSKMDPNSTMIVLEGLDATPDVAVIRDANTDEYLMFLFHQWYLPDGDPFTGTPTTGLKFDAAGQTIVLNPAYPTRGSYTKPNGDVTYGERVFFDNSYPWPAACHQP